jgi:hypothetical protein
MKTSWQAESGEIVCRWSVAQEHVPYNPPWIQEAANSLDRSVMPALPDFTLHSPLGSGEWFVPWSARWSVPGKMCL